MTIKLGSTKIAAKSDGGISIYPNASSTCHFPVLCIEVAPPFFSRANHLGKTKETPST
jgi:hypothetical protein